MSSASTVALNSSSYRRSHERVSVLTVLCDCREQSELDRLLSHSNWRIHSVSSFGRALAFLRASTVGVVVVQYQPSGDCSWRNLLEETRRMTPSPRLIVTDRLADEAMWAEVLNLGAHDLLVQPFVPREVFHVITCAWHFWKTEWDCRNAGAGVGVARPNAA
jgi:DNA-binding response OmpR family regulator